MTKIHGKVFAQSALDRERDEALGQRMAALSFVRPEHLDIPAVYQDEKVTTSCACTELRRVNSARYLETLCTLLGDSLCSSYLQTAAGAALPASFRLA